MLLLMIQDEMVGFRRNRLIQVGLAFIALMVPVALLAPREHVQMAVQADLAWTVHLAALITGSVIVASLIADLQQGVPILFVVRPVPRAYVLLARGAAMAALLVLALAVGLGILFLLDAAWVKVQLDAQAILAGLLLARIPGILVALACGLLIGVRSASMASGMVGFMLLANNLILALVFLSAKITGWAGLSPAAGDLVYAGLSLLSTILMLLVALRAFARRSI